MNRLRELREDRDLVQREIAEVLGMSQSSYSYYETSGSLLTENILQMLANYYNTSIDYILYRTDVRKPYPKSVMDKEEDEDKIEV